MDLELDGDEAEVVTAVRRVVAEPDAWPALQAGGWLDLLVDDPRDGLRYLGLVAEELGAAGVAVPFVGTAAVYPTLTGKSSIGRRVGVVASGDNVAEDGAGAEVIVMLEGHLASIYDHFSARPIGGLGGSLLARVRLPADPMAVVADSALVERAKARAAAVVAAEMAGVIRSVVELTVTYVKTRQQFGRPLCRFQAVAHGAARLATLGDAAVGLARLACQTSEAAHIHAAKGWASEAAVEVSALAHQLHGAIGFTEEYGLGRLTQRLRILRFAFGDDTEHFQALGRLSVEGVGGLVGIP